jgi:heme A synthase
VSAAYCHISSLLLFSSLVLTVVVLVLAWRDSPKASIICLGFVLLQVVVASLTVCPSIIDPRAVPVIGGPRR